MAEVLMSGATGILKKLVGVVSGDIASALDVKDDLKKLQTTSEMILAVISDAEKRQGKEELVRLWLRKLKGIAYDADDVIDGFSYEAMRRRDTKDGVKRKVLKFASSSNPPRFAFRLKMAKQMKDINTRLEDLTQQMDTLKLEGTAPIPDGESSLRYDREFTSHVNESEIVGREYDESQLLKLLTIDSTTSSDNISVISIVGMGGLGKTTLAQLVYKSVKKLFELTMWVHVSENFNTETILVNIMESITETKFHKPSNFHVLVDIVREKLNGKKYLLVLDDLWNEDSEQWESVKSVLLVGGGSGSKILITTRKEQVASIVRGSIPPYHLSRLEDDACWSIIKRKAFSPGGALDAQEMCDIGKEIARKCCGLPLAAKFLGSLMRLKTNQSDWISIRDDDIWNTPESKRRILPVLKLSYNHLPSHLKQCFSYCAIFPKNWEIRKETLVNLWMAEGFLKQSNTRNERISIEDFGRDYFESLARSSFFQDFKKNELGDIETCKMHDLVHDLAQDVLAENEILLLKASKFTDVSKAYRLRVDLDEDVSTTSLTTLSDAKKLRTLFIPEGSNLNPSMFFENNLLRILHVGASPTPCLLKVSSLKVKLKHLRYLRLTLLDLREIGDDHSISTLYNLETLVLSRIAGVQSLLTNIQSLQKLRYIEVSWTDMEELPDSVTTLCNLRTLDLNNNGALEVIPDSISGLKNLRFLNLSFNPIEELPVSVATLSNLQTLDVSACTNLKALPESVSGLTNLRVFDFKNCPLLRSLPEDIGALTQFRYLNLDGTAIKVLPESCANLGNLEYVDLSCCQLPKEATNWIKLRKCYHRGTIPMGISKLLFLQTLTYKVREKVASQPECSNGIEELANLNSLEVLAIGGLQNVKDPIDAERTNLKAKRNLHQLALVWDEIQEGELSAMSWDQKLCNDQVFEALQPCAGLRTLGVYNFMGWDLPSWMLVPDTLMNLDILVLQNCKEIKQLPASLGQLSRLKHLHLRGMSLKNLDIGGFPSLMELHLTDMLLLEELCYSYPCLQDLRITNCERLTEMPAFPCLEILLLKKKIDPELVCAVGRSQASLTGLWLNYIEDLVYFPVSILRNNRNLRILHILECNRFRGFPVTDDDQNAKVVSLYGSLQKLKIFDCPAVAVLPDLRGWTSLQTLTIRNCPLVKESLNYDLKSLPFLKELYVDFIQRDEQQRDPSVGEELINLMW